MPQTRSVRIDPGHRTQVGAIPSIDLRQRRDRCSQPDPPAGQDGEGPFEPLLKMRRVVMTSGAHVDASPVFVVCLALHRMWAVGAPQIVRLWRHTTTFFDAGRDSDYGRARTRCYPFFAVCGLAMILDGWILVVDSFAPPADLGIGVRVVVAACAAVFASSLVIGASSCSSTGQDGIDREQRASTGVRERV